MPTWALRLLPYALGAVVAIWLGLVIRGWKLDSDKLPKVEKEFEVYRTQIETDRRVRKEVSDGYQSEIAGLRANQRPAPAVRLCVNPPTTEPRAPIGDHGPSTTTGQLSEGTGTSPLPGRNIGGELFAIADRADLLAAQLRACQAFVTKLGASSLVANPQ